TTFFFFQAEDGIRGGHVTGVQTCALPIWLNFQGSPQYKWQDLAAKLRSILVDRLGVAEPYLAKFRPVVCSRGGDSTRYLVQWSRSEERRVGKECRAGRAGETQRMKEEHDG